MKFIQPVSMKVTEEQFKRDLKQPLLDLGYEIYCDNNFDTAPVLTTNAMGIHSNAGNFGIQNRSIVGRYYIDHYNPELFLAIAAMTDEEYGIAGEWWIGLVDSPTYFSKGVLYKALSPINSVGCFVDDFGRKASNHLSPFLFHRKATVKELVSHFSRENGIFGENTQKDLKHTTTRKQVQKLHEKATCTQYRTEIEKFLKGQDVLADTYEVPNDLLRRAISRGNTDQIQLLKGWGFDCVGKIGGFDVEVVGDCVYLSEIGVTYFIVHRDYIEIRNTNSIANKDLQCIEEARKLLK